MQLIEPSVIGLLLFDVFTASVLVPSYRGYKIPSGPEIVAGEVFLLAEEAPCDVDGTFALDETNHLRHAIFGRDTDHHVHLVYHKLALQYPALPLHGELSEDLAQMLSELLIESLPAVLRNPYYMVLAVPYCVA
jgi:hypothetical protein